MKTPRLLIVLAALLFCGVACPPSVLAQAVPVPAQMADLSKMPTGQWSEKWGTADVKYHDEYRLGVDAEGKPSVTITTRKQEIKDVSYKAGVLSFTLMTNFPVKFALLLSPDGRSFLGTGTTPKQVVDVKWVKIE